MAYSWVNYFEDDYLPEHEGYFTASRLQEEISFLTKTIIPHKTVTILDLACGQGRHSIALAKQGYAVMGVDRDEQLLSLAYSAAKDAKVQVPFIQQDMRNLMLDQQFDVILLMFCTFGIESDEVNQTILQKLKSHLKPGGRIFFDIHNLFRFARRMKTPENANAKLDLTTLTLWDVIDGELVLPLRLYTVPELEERLATVNLRITKVWGNYDATPYSFDSERLLVLAEDNSPL